MIKCIKIAFCITRPLIRRYTSRLIAFFISLRTDMVKKDRLGKNVQFHLTYETTGNPISCKVLLTVNFELLYPSKTYIAPHRVIAT